MGSVYGQCKEQEFMVSIDDVREIVAEARKSYKPIGLTEPQLVAYADMCVQFIHRHGLLADFASGMNSGESLIGFAVSELFAEWDEAEILNAYKVAAADSIGTEDV